jgi:serine/threonine-protein kinase RsbW
MILEEKKVQKVISSDLSNIVLVERMIDSLAEELSLKEEYVANLYVALTEAVKNAIVFGNNEDINKNVIIDLEYSKQQLVAKIKDQGAGFDFNNIPDPTSPENIEKMTGRGLFLIKNLADNVEFLDNGSLIKLLFVFR